MRTPAHHHTVNMKWIFFALLCSLPPSIAHSFHFLKIQIEINSCFNAHNWCVFPAHLWPFVGRTLPPAATSPSLLLIPNFTITWFFGRFRRIPDGEPKYTRILIAAAFRMYRINGCMIAFESFPILNPIDQRE